jgi:molybdopterin converting factor small subunit
VTVTVVLPPLLRPLAGGARTVGVEGSTIAGVTHALASQYPSFALHLRDEAGNLRSNIVFLHDGAMVRGPDADDHAVRDGDEIVMTNALQGG